MDGVLTFDKAGGRMLLREENYYYHPLHGDVVNGLQRLARIGNQCLGIYLLQARGEDHPNGYLCET